jgi:hypothetical protein
MALNVLLDLSFNNSWDWKRIKKKGDGFISTLAYIRSDAFSTGVTLETLKLSPLTRRIDRYELRVTHDIC